ncbi:ATP-dependent DNA helicase DinG [Alkalicoccus daliensis]|uniref:3'-5' exonuclease DinG n=1 Tax=Alkalicoccus daliensis TaxID=745820 RepID=A0A1H0ASL2_9BACI|nr:ATP-dependent DNA helicase DinG [Alkalicoccus daliensis]SDN36490.1 ATP-dependent DNA helicase DinG [Alkalicoccus daliensis]
MLRFVVLDLETTGVSYTAGDRIIQLAYSIIENNKIIKTYNSYIHTDQDIPPFVQQLTQIDREKIKNAPAFSEVAPELLRDLNNAYFVAHNVDFDLYFLNESLEDAGYDAFEGPVLDTVELSRITFPTEDSYKLSELSETLDVLHEAPHRADSDAMATAELLLKNLSMLKSLPKAVLKHLLGLQNGLKSDIRPILEEFFEESSDDLSGIEEYRGIALKKENNTKAEYESETTSFEDLFSLFQNPDKMSEIMPDFIRREGQEKMMHFVHKVLSNDQIGLAEAGTGTGKTLAYLLPAACFSVSRGERVVISTETIQLQEQLLKREVPLIDKFLPFPVRTALLKGRSHYICLQKVETLLDTSFQDVYERTLAKAQILVWLTETATGDIEELNLAAASDRFLREITSDPDSCRGPECPWFSRCFYQRAKKSARHADIIITNHALLLTDIVHDSQVLPGYDSVIIDEAHHLEEAATRQFGLNLNYADMAQLLNEWSSKDSSFTLESWLDLNFGELWNSCREQLAETRMEWNDLFLTIFDYANKNSGRIDTGDLSKIIEYNKDWEVVTEAASRFSFHIKKSLADLFTIQQQADDKWDTAGEYQRERAAITKYLNELEEMNRQFEQLILQHDDNHVYWMERSARGPKQSISIYRSPTDVSNLLADRFFQKKKRALLTSATLTVNRSFDYIIRQLGLEDFEIAVEQVESPFHWENQVAFMVPEDMPLIQSDGEEAYIYSLVHAVYQVSQVSKGKMLVLFTSYDMLKKAHNLLQPMLDESFLLIGQGIQSKSRTKLVKMFQQFDQTILFGTSSFWEGVDIPGDDLSIIVMARLPFSPPNDPVFQAKSAKLKDKGASPFMKLALPQAVLRFKQGFGRLIRRETDRGVVLVLDRRIVTAKYGKQFIKSLPDIPLREKSIHEIEKDIHEWLYEIPESGGSSS